MKDLIKPVKKSLLHKRNPGPILQVFQFLLKRITPKWGKYTHQVVQLESTAPSIGVVVR